MRVQGEHGKAPVSPSRSIRVGERWCPNRYSTGCGRAGQGTADRSFQAALSDLFKPCPGRKDTNTSLSRPHCHGRMDGGEVRREPMGTAGPSMAPSADRWTGPDPLASRDRSYLDEAGPAEKRPPSARIPGLGPDPVRGRSQEAARIYRICECAGQDAGGSFFRVPDPVHRLRYSPYPDIHHPGDHRGIREEPVVNEVVSQVETAATAGTPGNRGSTPSTATAPSSSDGSRPPADSPPGPPPCGPTMPAPPRRPRCGWSPSWRPNSAWTAGRTSQGAPLAPAEARQNLS